MTKPSEKETVEETIERLVKSGKAKVVEDGPSVAIFIGSTKRPKEPPPR